MSSYLYALFLLCLALSLGELLRPGKEGEPLGKAWKAFCSLLLLCTLASPLRARLPTLRQWTNGEGGSLFPESPSVESPALSPEEALTEASKAYFLQLLTQNLEQEFSISPGQIRCTVEWTADTNGAPHPGRVTLLLSGNAIWKDPHAMEAYVSSLLNCECQSAIE